MIGTAAAGRSSAVAASNSSRSSPWRSSRSWASSVSSRELTCTSSLATARRSNRSPIAWKRRPALNNEGRRYTWETYPERRQRAGITWCVYHERDDFGCNVCKHFPVFADAAPTSDLSDALMRDRSFDDLLHDLRTANIPQVTWIVPPSTVTEHPRYMPAAGENHTRQVLEALWSNSRL